MSIVVHIEKASLCDAKVLAEISKNSFDSDVCCGGKGPGGPPGYDSISWQQKVIEAVHYYKVMIDQRIIGGVIVSDQEQGVYNLMRIYIDPAYHKRGFGLAAMSDVLSKYPDAKRWWLDTPAWNTRTRPFYLKCGFQIKEEKDGFLIFEREA